MGASAVGSEDIVFGILSWPMFTVCAVVEMTRSGPKARGSKWEYAHRAISYVADVENIGRSTKKTRPALKSVWSRTCACGASCRTVEWLSIAYQQCAAFWIDRIRVGSKALSMLFWVFCQSSVSSVRRL